MVLGACGFSRYLRGWVSGEGPLILALIPVVPVLPGIKISGPTPNPLLFLLTQVLREGNSKVPTNIRCPALWEDDVSSA